MGRPRKYATAAERQKAYRERKDRTTPKGTPVNLRVMQIVVSENDYETIQRLKEAWGGQSTNDFMYDLIGWALKNRNWTSPVRFRYLPRAPNPDDDEGFDDVFLVQVLSGVRTDGWRTLKRFLSNDDAIVCARSWAQSHPMDSVRVVRSAP